MRDTNHITTARACFDFLDLFGHVPRRRVTACILSMLFFVGECMCDDSHKSIRCV